MFGEKSLQFYATICYILVHVEVHLSMDQVLTHTYSYISHIQIDIIFMYIIVMTG